MELLDSLHLANIPLQSSRPTADNTTIKIFIETDYCNNALPFRRGWSTTTELALKKF